MNTFSDRHITYTGTLFVL